MARGRFTDDSRDILEGRPNIEFVEPETEGFTAVPEDVEDVPELPNVQERRHELRQFAQAINVLATATQARVDDKAKNMKIKLDLNVDIATVQAMRRYFPDSDPTEITYDQYRQVKECLRSLGREIGQKVLVDPADVQAARESLGQDGPTKAGKGSIGTPAAASMGGYGTLEASNGQLRPEADLKAYVIPPLDVESFNIDLVCIFINFVWKTFIMRVFSGARIPPFGPSLADILPDQICDPGFKMDIPGLWILGERPPDLLVGALTPEIPTSFNEVAPQDQQIEDEET